MRSEKANLEVHLKNLKNEISELKKRLNDKISDKLVQLELTKQLKILENDLRKQENDLFFDIAQVDVDTETEIKELTSKTRFRVSPECYFKLYFERMHQKIQEETLVSPLEKYIIS